MAPDSQGPDIVAPSPGDPLPTGPWRRIDIRSLSISILAGATLILLLKWMQPVIIPFVLSGLGFYALDPIVDRLQRLRVPRSLAAALVLLSLLCGGSLTVYNLSDNALAVVEELPAAARKLRLALRGTPGEPPGVLEKMQDAATELDRAAAEATGTPPPSSGVMRVRLEEPGVAGDFIRWGSAGVLTLGGQALMILFLTYFLLVADDLFKRKVLKHFGDTLSRKKITVQLIDQIGEQIQRFLLVQIFASALVAIVTGLALWLLGVEQAAVWGLAAGVFNSVPYVGPVIVAAGLSMVAFMQFGTLSMMAAVAGISLLITTLEGWLLTPILQGRAARMNHVAMFAGLLFWSWVWGVWGLLLAVPMMMVGKSVCDHIESLQPISDFLGE